VQYIRVSRERSSSLHDDGSAIILAVRLSACAVLSAPTQGLVTMRGCVVLHPSIRTKNSYIVGRSCVLSRVLLSLLVYSRRQYLDLLSTMVSLVYNFTIAYFLLFGCDVCNLPLYLPSLLSPHMHPDQCACPQTHCNADRDHGIHSTSKVRCEVCSIEHDTPPRIDRIASHVHTRYDHCAEAVFFIAENVVGPSEKSRLAGIHATCPVVHSKVDCRALRVC
jgi:hypothetical protein